MMMEGTCYSQDEPTLSSLSFLLGLRVTLILLSFLSGLSSSPVAEEANVMYLHYIVTLNVQTNALCDSHVFPTFRSRSLNF